MNKYIVLILASFLMILAGCKRDDDFDGTTMQPVPFNVTVKYSATAGGGVAKNANVTLKNNSTGETFTGTTDSNGELKLSAVLPGQYNIAATVSLTQQQYFDTFGIATNKDSVVFNGIQDNTTINVNISSTIITLETGTVGDFVIKQYYYAGSNTSTGAGFRDHFIEIFNNSNQVLYADGLYVALLEGNTNNTVASYTQANGQYDWSQSTGNNIGASANTDYVYSSSVIRIPGSGTEYPIQPGQSFVIAQTGINHKAPYTTNGGVNVPISDPTQTVDLSNAEFETYLGDFLVANGGSVYTYDIQNPAVKDMQIVYWTSANKDMLLNATTRPAVVIFKDVTDAQFSTYAKVPAPNALTGRLFVRIPKNVIMDGVDTTSKTLTAPKDLTSDIDAGRAYIQNTAGEAYADYTGYSVIRKTKEVISGRKILQDTNNSTNDFTTIKAEPKAYAP